MNKSLALMDVVTFNPAALRGFNCPGFNHYKVLGTDGKMYLVASDDESGVSVRMFMRTDGALDASEVTLVGPNPIAEQWNRMMFPNEYK